MAEQTCPRWCECEGGCFIKDYEDELATLKSQLTQSTAREVVLSNLLKWLQTGEPRGWRGRLWEAGSRIDEMVNEALREPSPAAEALGKLSAAAHEYHEALTKGWVNILAGKEHVLQTAALNYIDALRALQGGGRG